MDTRITEQDMAQLRAFPCERKLVVMQRIMAHEPDVRTRLDGRNDFEKVLLRLRRDGFTLIDLQRQEMSFTSVWYRKGDGLLLGRRRPEATLLVWELEEKGATTTFLTWWL